MKRNKLRKIMKGTTIVLMSVCLFFLLSTVITTGETVKDYKLLVGLPGMAENTAPGLGPYLVNMFKIGIGVAGVLAVIMITIGGVQYMTTEAIGEKSSAKTRINNAIFGLVLALSSYLLLNTINTDLVKGTLTLISVPPPQETPLPVADGRWYGYYKCGKTGATKLCEGDNGPSCSKSCSDCPKITKIIGCKPDLSYEWSEGSCIIDGEKKKIQEPSETICEREMGRICTPKNPISVQPCREVEGDPGEEE